MEKTIDNDFFHYAKHNKAAILDDFTTLVEDCKEWCPFTHHEDGKIDEDCYMSHGGIKEIILFLKRYMKLSNYLELGPQLKESTEGFIDIVQNPYMNRNVKIFKDNIDMIKKFIEKNADRFFNKLKNFTCLESMRIWEAVRCFEIQGYLASTVLIVSAIEGRLHTLIKGKNEEIFNKYIDGKPFGKIIHIRSLSSPENGQEEIKGILDELIPEEHMPLIKLLNYYRIVSAHPKDSEIDFNVASSIIHLSFAFLLDKNLKIPGELCDEREHAPAK